jgi:hypothetical protein
VIEAWIIVRVGLISAWCIGTYIWAQGALWVLIHSWRVIWQCLGCSVLAINCHMDEVCRKYLGKVRRGLRMRR